ncbi:hypothetical protein V5E97_22285 [Singulisphaera sp. Ch08]|uniref:Uncharacterized protein n=1 Tax=Singulisphaera sp. Ch08 TaxID=3120278 RepID=A0AAU7C7I0_9BACT
MMAYDMRGKVQPLRWFWRMYKNIGWFACVELWAAMLRWFRSGGSLQKAMENCDFLLSWGDKTAIELFLREFQGWDAGLRLILAPSNLAGV